MVDTKWKHNVSTDEQGNMDKSNHALEAHH